MSIWSTISRTVVTRYTNKGLKKLEEGQGCLPLAKGCFNFFTWVGGIAIIATIIGNLYKPGFNLVDYFSIKADTKWKGVNIGDSLFVQSAFEITFYKKGQVPLSKADQLKQKQKFTLNFISQNRIDENCLVESGSTFIGICVEKDSTKTDEGLMSDNLWLKIEPNPSFAQLKKQKAKSCIWKNQSFDKTTNATLLDGFYVKLKEVQLVDKY